ncbi:hypothetical protein JTE90_009293 [Oedothorax gibbosus]|uniref:Uncharacterized protein n=1 Tax=Oedothorax gibbosus TaxID=931172 RepID=A0AAV6TKJ2_9ARAC|nr:hypothetical protein JTE90_009293 [Oedothorax gibbosus]
MSIKLIPEPSSHNLELSKSFPAAGLDSHFVSSPVPSASAFGLNYVPSGYIDIKQNVQPSLSSSCPAPSRLQQPMQLGQQFLEARYGIFLSFESFLNIENKICGGCH